MSTAAVSSSSLSNQLQTYFQARGADLQQLGKALSNGDLAGAQTAFNSIVSLGQNGPSAQGNPFLNSQREQDFDAIGSALQAGDLSGAQQAFATLKSTAQNQSQTASTGSSNVGPEIVFNLSNSSGSTPEQITININQENGGGEQISIGVGAQGSNPQNVTFNLGANSNEEIVLNLLGNPASTASTPSAAASSGLSVSA